MFDGESLSVLQPSVTFLFESNATMAPSAVAASLRRSGVAVVGGTGGMQHSYYARSSSSWTTLSSLRPQQNHRHGWPPLLHHQRSALGRCRSIAIGTDMVSSVISLQKARPWYTCSDTGSNQAADNQVLLSELFAPGDRGGLCRTGPLYRRVHA
jgi:hypothetical protein